MKVLVKASGQSTWPKIVINKKTLKASVEYNTIDLVVGHTIDLNADHAALLVRLKMVKKVA